MNPTQSILLERRSNAVAAVERGEAAAVVARVNAIPMRTLFGWLARYRAGGWAALLDRPRSGHPRKANPETALWLREAVVANDPRRYGFEFRLRTLAVVRGVLQRHRGLELSKSALCRLLKELGLTPRTPARRSYKQDAGDRAEWLRRTFPKLRRLARRSARTSASWTRAPCEATTSAGARGAGGVTPVVADSGDRFGLNLVSAVSPRGDLRFAVIEGRMDSERFVAFLRDLRADAGRPIIVVADNASCHGSARVEAFVKENEEIHLARLPAYSPDLNPDEQVWNHLKRRLEQLAIDSKAAMREATLAIMESIRDRRDLVRSFFRMEGTRYAAM